MSTPGIVRFLTGRLKAAKEKDMNRSTEVYSIYGQIESVIADTMVKEGKATKIEQDMIPPSQLFDEDGRKAKFAIVIPRTNLSEFERRVRNLRA
jgi:hypothetical protein